MKITIQNNRHKGLSHFSLWSIVEFFDTVTCVPCYCVESAISTIGEKCINGHISRKGFLFHFCFFPIPSIPTYDSPSNTSSDTNTHINLQARLVLLLSSAVPPLCRSRQPLPFKKRSSPRSMAPKIHQNHYEILSLPETCTAEEVNRRYKVLSMRHHPDKGGDANVMATVSLPVWDSVLQNDAEFSPPRSTTREMSSRTSLRVRSFTTQPAAHHCEAFAHLPAPPSATLRSNERPSAQHHSPHHQSRSVGHMRPNLTRTSNVRSDISVSRHHRRRTGLSRELEHGELALRRRLV